MQKEKSSLVYHLLADVVFACHLIIVWLILLGWLSGQLLPVYSAAVIVTFLSEYLLGYCPLTRLECALRRMADSESVCGNGYLSYYAYRLKVTPGLVSDAQMEVAARVVLVVSLLVLAYRLSAFL
jgi:hypothetical protein